MSDINIRQEEWKKLYESLSNEHKKQLLKALHNPSKFKEIHKQAQEIFFVEPPPTPEEFLNPDNGWIPRHTAEQMFPEVKENFINILKGNYRNIALYGATRTGKSFTERLLIVYTIVYMHHLRSVNDFFGIPTRPAIYLMSFKLDKARQLLMKPVYDLMEGAYRYIKVHNQATVYKEQVKYGKNRVVWSKAADVGEITLTSGVQILLGNAMNNSIIGSDAFSLYISEISFFIEQAGTTEDEIFQLYTDGIARIQATFGNQPMTWVYLDTSANLADSVIENYILNTLRHEPDTYFRSFRQWDVKTEDRVPIYLKTGETFTVCSGNGKYPAKLDPSPEEMEDIPKDLIHEVPIDYRKRFEENLTKSIKDILGVPTTSESKFIQNGKIIERMFDNPSLQNEIALIKADSSVNPDKYLWNMLKDKYFTQYDNKNWQIKRSANEGRYVGGDIAFARSGDIAGLSMGHWEWSREEMCNIFVYDFTLAIGPGENGISIAVLRQFIIDMAEIGNVPIAGIAYDTFNSKDGSQILQRRGFKFVDHKIDGSTEAYDTFLEHLLSGTMKAGPNIFLKNNLLNLEKVERKGQKGGEKVDHPLGKTNNVYNGDWSKSTCGYYAKDVSDAAAQALFLAYTEAKDYQPRSIYEKENKRLNMSVAVSEADTEEIIKEYYAKFNRRYSF